MRLTSSPPVSIPTLTGSPAPFLAEGAHEVGFSNKLTRKRHVSGVEVRWELEEELGAARQYAGFLNGGTKSS